MCHMALNIIGINVLFSQEMFLILVAMIRVSQKSVTVDVLDTFLENVQLFIIMSQRHPRKKTMMVTGGKC